MKNRLFVILAISNLTLLLCSCNSANNNHSSYHTIVWLNHDNTLLEKDENVSDGEMPSYDGVIPSKESENPEEYSYIFDGWEPNVVPAYHDATYVAKFCKLNIYTVTWVDYDGTKLGTEKYNAGETPKFKGSTPIKPRSAQYSYFFDGWYPEIQPVTGNIQYQAQYYEQVNKYTITFKNYDGKKLESNQWEYGNYPSYKGTTPAKPKTNKYHYTFCGWDPSITKVTGPATYTAKFKEEINKYSLTFNANGGKVSTKNLEVQYGKSFTLPNPTRDGYTFLGWYYNDIKIESGTWDYDIDFEITLVARWNKLYKITYELDGGENSTNNPGLFTIDDSIVFSDPTRDGYTFLRWCTENGNTITEILPNTISNDISLFAQWKPNKNTLSITSLDETKGSVEISSGEGYSGETISIKATPVSDCVFGGWFDGATRMSGDASYSFEMPVHDYTISALFFNSTEEKELWNSNHGLTPVLDSDNNRVFYGLYPQDCVTNTELNSVLNTKYDCVGVVCFYEQEFYIKHQIEWGVGSTNNWYEKFKCHDNSYCYSGEYYWFKYMPIKWDIMQTNANEYTLITSCCIDSCQYFTVPCAYAYDKSELRRWLNEDFLSQSFPKDESFIKVTTVKNDVSTMRYKAERFTCDDTSDKVFAMSYQDYKELKYTYGYNFSSPRTDWTYTKQNDESYKFWTRSPEGGTNDSYRASVCANDDGCSSNIIYRENVRPMINLILSNAQD